MMDKRGLICKEGYPFIAAGMLVTVVCFFFVPQYSFWGIFFSIITVFTIFFFRNPPRILTGDDQDIISPADGKVIDISEQIDGYFTKEKRIRVSIFMSVFNVHVNRIPVSGTVTASVYNKGKFLPAMKEKASRDNEQHAIKLVNRDGKIIVVVQIAGLIARRIVNYLNKGKKVKRGDLFGLIRFGSRVDLYLPSETNILVSLGNKVIGGETIIGRLTNEKSSEK